MSRDVDCRWITQFSALFCVLNGNGQVVTWKLTKNMTFNNVEDQLVSLHERLMMQGKNVLEFYIDNCCSWRNKLQQVFGAHLSVKLDIFHAVKRISDKIPKRHPLRNDCVKYLSMVFRDPQDRGDSRLMETPDPNVLVAQLDVFLQKWETVQYKSWSVLSPSAIKEAHNVKQHILKGFLSGIKPGRGTNRNEALHKKLNKIVTSSRYGVELAYALFSTIFFMHNEKIAAKIENRREKVILEYDDGISHLTSKEYFGIQCTSDITSIPESKASEVYHLTLQRSSYSDFVHRITDGVKEHAMTGQSQIYQDTFSSQSDDEEFIIPLHALKLILLKALSWYFVHEHMSKQTKRAKIPLKDLPFMNSSLSKLFNCGNLEADQSRSILSDATNNVVVNEYSERLDNVLKAWNFKRVPASGR